jgi:hypothetical protein
VYRSNEFYDHVCGSSVVSIVVFHSCQLRLFNDLPSSMPTRNPDQLSCLFSRRYLRNPSNADGPGEIYILFEHFIHQHFVLLKVGMTVNFQRRWQQHQTLCPNPARAVFARRLVPFRRRFGKFCSVHHHNDDWQPDRVIISFVDRGFGGG